MAANHRENTRLVGFIARRTATTPASNDNVNMCYVFESNSDGADVCCAIATAQVGCQEFNFRFRIPAGRPFVLSLCRSLVADFSNQVCCGELSRKLNFFASVASCSYAPSSFAC